MDTVDFMTKADQESKLLIAHAFTLMLSLIMIAIITHGEMGTVLTVSV